MQTRILPYRTASAGAAALGAALGIRRLRTEGSRFRPRERDLIVNWGAHVVPDRLNHTPLKWLNYPFSAAAARDKLTCLRKLQDEGVPTVEWTQDRDLAMDWWAGGADVFCRTTTTGQGGSGIVVVTQNDAIGYVEHSTFREFPRAPLYTKRYNATHEYRVHVVAGHTFVTKKRRRDGVQPALVRNHANGYVYCTENVDPVPLACEVAVAAVQALGLDFGAVDLMTKNGGVEPRVLEVNTAPGIEGRTIDWYATRIGELISEVA